MTARIAHIVKRGVLAAFGGKAFLKEEAGAERLAGATMVFAEVLVIALAG